MSSEQPTAEHYPEPADALGGAAVPEPPPEQESGAWGQPSDGFEGPADAAAWGQPSDGFEGPADAAAAWDQSSDGFETAADPAVAQPGSGLRGLAEQRPELLVGGAFAGGVLLALIVRRLRG